VSDTPPNVRDVASDTEVDEAYCAACNNSFTIDAMFCPNDGAKLVKLKSQPDALIGRVFDNRYEIRAALGHGGMGTVYRGWQLSVDREVAIKVIHAKFTADRVIAKRFLREARLASRLNQPNIVNVYDFGQSEDGILYLVMELLRGKPLAKELESQRPVSMKRLKTMASQVCDALDAAHNQDIIHRDLKPGNIVVLDEPVGRDFLKILDFGLAKSLQENTSLVTKTDAILGTPLYMPPEQILGKPSDRRADLYSFGCILYQLATGRPPYIGDNVNVVIAAHVRDPIPELPEGVPRELADAITKLMAKEPADRFQHAREVREALEAVPEDAAGASYVAMKTPPPLGVRSDVIQSVPADSAIGVPVKVTSSVGTAVTAPSLDARPPAAPRRWWLGVLALVAAGAIGFIAFKLLSNEKTVEPKDAATATASDAAKTADAAVTVEDAVAAVADAGEPADARSAGADARVRPPADARIAAPRPDARVAVPVDAAVAPRPDAAVAMPRDAAIATPRDAANVPADAVTVPKDAPLDLPLLPLDAGRKRP
jgi:serine/threonine-protein kinase